MNVAISVLMSVYNGERWLRESIESILNQTFKNFEFIIVNDGSTDSSPLIINQYATQDKRIKIINKPNTGLADSLNQGINSASGEWIARIDADDLFVPNRLEIQYKLAKSDPDLVLIGSGLIEIDEFGKKLKCYRYPLNNELLRDRLLKFKSFFAHSSSFYRAEVVKKLGGYRISLRRAQDFDLWLRLSEVGKIACVYEPLVYIRKHSGQVSHEDKGRRQLIDATVALVSYFLRKKGYRDPIEGSEEEFEVFWKFVEAGIEQNGFFKYQEFINQIKNKLHSSESIIGYLEIIALLGKHPNFFINYLFQKFFGVRFAKKLADLWIRNS